MSVEDRMAPVVAGTVERTVPALSRAASSARGAAPSASSVWWRGLAGTILKGLGLAVFAFMLFGPLANLALAAVAALGYIVVFASLIGYGIWNTLLRRYPASTVAPFSLLVPVTGIAAAWLWLGEVPGVAEWIGAVAVLLGLLVLSTTPPAAAPAAPAAPELAATTSG